MDAFTSTPNIPIEGTNHAGSLYFLQVKPTDSMECVPLQLIINDLAHSKECYLTPVQLDNSQYFAGTCVEATPCSSKSLNELCQAKSMLQHYGTLNQAENSKSQTKTLNSCQLDSVQESCGKQVNKSKSKYGSEHQIPCLVHIADRTVPPRAIAVLPTVLQFRRDFISPRRPLPERVRFGPVQGVREEVLPAEIDKLILASVTTHSPIFLSSKRDNSAVHINTADKDKSNWLSLLPLGDQTTANVWLYEESGEIYGATTKSIGPRTPLTFGYGKIYAERYGLPPSVPILDLDDALPSGLRQWWCFECNRAMGSAALLERHVDVYHKDERPPIRRRYRCPQCTRTFSRLFTLNRHRKSFCTKKTEKTIKSHSGESSPTKTDTVSYTAQNTDDSKVPSDESLQNYTNGLDFSTNLFDTDHMPSLDISGSSKSENDFNPYGGAFKDDSQTNCVGNSNGSQQNKKKSAETLLTSCPYCSKIIVSGKKRHHFRECMARRFQCECGLFFHKKQNLELHIDKEHSDLKTRSIDSIKKPSEPSYVCDTCKITFKRRGMLVNHLWRVHNTLTNKVPLERRVKHYPCVACPKIYRTACKRNIHVKNHHPGLELIRVAPIEGERRACEPASCWECPRQYATNSKLLQHVRREHPHLAIPTRSKSSVRLESNKDE